MIPGINPEFEFTEPASREPEAVPVTGTPVPEPKFTHRAYGVDLSYVGEDGGMVARGHVPDLRFVAACNHLARKEAGLFDDSSETLKDTLSIVSREWAIAVDPEGDGEWAVQWGGITEQTPGSFPVTVLWP